MYNFKLTPEQEDHAREIHESSVIIDMLVESSLTDSLFDNMQKGGLSCGSFTIGAMGLQQMSSGGLPHHDDWWSYHITVKDLSHWNGMFADPGIPVVPIHSVADIEDARKSGNPGILLNTQNSLCVGTDIDNLEFFYNLGLRVIQLTYNLQNFMGSGCLEDPEKNLSNFGIQAIGRMNELGILVDTGHTGDGSLKHAIDVSEKPISCSHAGLAAKSKAVNPRVQSDSALKKLADNGGVFGLSAIPGMLTGDVRCTIDDYLDHFEHVINVMGIDHAGIGSDFSLGTTLEQVATAPDWKGQQVPHSVDVWPVTAGHDGFEEHSKYMNLTRGLVSRGYSDNDIKKLMGGNWLRLFGETIG